ncbi:MAG: hypothetical protein ACI4GW_09430 [Lachnospiraceae bacterium]
MVDFIIVSVFMIISLTLVIVGCILLFSKKKGCTVEVTAIVEKKESHYNYNSHHKYSYGILGYNYNGFHFNARGRRISSSNQVGSQHLIKINPNNPQKYYQKEDLYIPIYIMAIGGFMSFAAMITLLRILFDLIFG